jgi:hypothetical protein
MNDIEKLLALTKEVKPEDVKKLDRVYNEILYPKIENAASKFKARELRINDNCHDNPMYFKLAEIMGDKNANLQSLIETKMKPYLEEKGFRIGICSPRYFVYIRW